MAELPNLVQNKTVTPTGQVSPGQTLTYTMTVQNTGGTAATGVVAVDNLPAGVTFVSATPSVGTFDSSTGTWTIGTVDPGQTVTLVITATVNADATGTLLNRFQVTEHPNAPDPDVENVCTDNPAQSCAENTVIPPTTPPPGEFPSTAPPSGQPVSTITPSPIPPVSGTSPAATIPFTGVDIGWPLTSGLAAIVLGIPLAVAARRRRSRLRPHSGP